MPINWEERALHFALLHVVRDSSLVRPSAQEDVVERMKDRYYLSSTTGELQARPNGSAPYRHTSPGRMSPGEYIVHLHGSGEAPHLFVQYEQPSAARIPLDLQSMSPEEKIRLANELNSQSERNL